MRNKKLHKLNVESGGTYAAGGLIRIPLSQLGSASQSGKLGAHTYVAGILIRSHHVIANATGGQIVIGARKQHDMIRRVHMSGGASKEPYFNFPNYGGQMLRVIGRLLGRRAEKRSDDTVANAASTPTTYLTYFLPCFDPRSKKPEDTMIPARTLKDVVLELNWCDGAAGGEFGAGVSVTSGAIDEVTVLLVDKDHFRKETKWSWTEKPLASINDSSTLPAGHKFTDVVLVARSVGAYADGSFAVADITKVEYGEESGELLVRNTIPGQLFSMFNLECAEDGDAELGVYEVSATCREFLPIRVLSRARQEGFVAGDATASNPTITLTGTITPANTSVLARMIDPSGEDDLVVAMKAAGIEPSDKFLASVGDRKYTKAKTESKVKAREDKAQFLPQVVIPGGVK